LAELAKGDLKRFVALMDRAPDEVNPEYFSSVVGAVGDPESGADLDLVLTACRRAHALPMKACGRAICRAAEQRASERLPAELVEMVAWYGAYDPDPAEELWEREASRGQAYFGGSIEMAGINSNRGAAALAIAAVLFHGDEHLDRLRPVLERMVDDPSISVRTCVAGCLMVCLKHDREWSVDQFLRLVETREELLGTREVERFLYYTILTDYVRMAPTIERMVSSDNDDVAAAGARQGCLASLENEAARSVRDRCLAGRGVLRTGAADIFAANVRSTGYRELCEEALRQLFDDEDEGVRKSAAHAFSTLRDSELADFESLALAFVASAAFEGNQHDLRFSLERCEVSLPLVTVTFADRFLELAGASAGDIRTHQAADAPAVSELVVRVYSQTDDAEIRNRALDIIDKMALLQTYGLDNALEDFERI